MYYWYLKQTSIFIIKTTSLISKCLTSLLSYLFL